MESAHSLYHNLKEKSKVSLDGITTMSSMIVNETIIFFAYNHTSKLRSIYIDVGEVSWDEGQVRTLPVWGGASAQVEWHENIGPLFTVIF